MLVGVPIGVAAAVKHDRPLDHVLRVVSLGGISMPTFWIALVSLYLFFFRLGWFPGGGRLDPGTLDPPHATGFFTLDALFAIHNLLRPGTAPSPEVWTEDEFLSSQGQIAHVTDFLSLWQDAEEALAELRAQCPTVVWRLGSSRSVSLGLMQPTITDQLRSGYTLVDSKDYLPYSSLQRTLFGAFANEEAPAAYYLSERWQCKIPE